MSSGKIKAYIAALLFVLITGFAFMALKICVRYGDSFELLAFRYFFAFVPCGIWFLVQKAKGRRKKKHTAKSFKYLLLTAGFYFGFMVFQIVAMVYATSIEGTLVYAATPIFAKLIARLILNERSTVLQNCFMGLTFAALVALIVLNATDINMSLPGIILMAIASLLSATSNVYMRYVRGTISPIEISLFISVGGCVIFNVANVVHHLVKFGSLKHYLEPLTHLEFLIAIAYLGAACLMLTVLLSSYMLTQLEIVQATIFGNVATMIAVIVGAVILKEPLHVYHIICAILIIGGVLGLSIAPAKAENSGKKI